MKNQIAIKELTELVNAAQTPTIEGRKVVADACKQLYNLIEEDVYNAGKEWMLTGMFNDLCNGNFAEPFMCEKKKLSFLSVVKIYNENIIPAL
jgi:hypothetical protein